MQLFEGIRTLNVVVLRLAEASRENEGACTFTKEDVIKALLELKNDAAVNPNDVDKMISCHSRWWDDFIS